MPTSQVEFTNDADVLTQVIAALKRLGDEDRQRVLSTVVTFFRSSMPDHLAGAAPTNSETGSPRTKSAPAFSSDLNLTAKEFILDKQPRTDVERVACLAYYLTHYRSTPHFRTLDLSKLNTEAAQPKFSNAATAVSNAVKQGYLVAAAKGQRQLSAPGEGYVLALPDREAAKAAMSALKPRRKRRAENKTNARDKK